MATGRVRARVKDRVAMVTLERPPVNAMNAAMRQALSKALSHFEALPDVDAIVISSEGKAFSAGIDVREIETLDAEPSSHALCQQIEMLAKPVVVALHGAALAAGAELALSARARVAGQDMTLGFPQVALGLPPSVGSIQRLVRLVGPAIAIEMLLSGRPVDRQVGARQGLVDRAAAGNVGSAARAFAQAIVSKDAVAAAPMTRSGHLRNGPNFVEAVNAGRKRAGTKFVLNRMVDCVEAVLLLPQAAALEFEQSAFVQCVAHPDSRALRHVFLAERRISAALLDGRSDTARTVTAKGQTVVARLFAAQDRAIVAMMRSGTTEVEVDAAMLEFGAQIGPFGRSGVKPRPGSPGVLRRVVAAVMAEGARCVEQGVVAQASDIDALAVQGMRWPRLRGGPMHSAEVMGLLGLSDDMKGWAQQDRVWEVPDMLNRAVLGGARFLQGD